MAMKRKIALFIPTLGKGGAERVVSVLSRLLCKEYELFLIICDGDEIEYEYFGKLISLCLPARKSIWGKMLQLIKRIWRLRQIRKNENFAAVISFLDTANLLNVLTKQKSDKAIISMRSYAFASQIKGSVVTKIKKQISLYVLRHADAVIPVSKEIERFLIKEWRIEANKIFTLYNPYEIKKIQELSKLPFNSLGIEERDFCFVTMGRLEREKGLWNLLKAFYVVTKKMQDVKLLIIGDGTHREKIQKFCQNNKISNKVILCGKMDNPFPCLRRADVYVLTSLVEGFPNALLEAMSCGVPVISADCKSGPREILFENFEPKTASKDIEKADYGLLIPAMECEENWNTALTKKQDTLVRAMLLLYEDELLRSIYAKKAAERARDFEGEKIVEEYRKVIEVVVNNSGE